MLVKFHINYPTKYGQEIVLDIHKVKDVECSEIFASWKMNYFDGTWICEVPASYNLSLKYRYRLLEANSLDINEAGCDRVLTLPKGEQIKEELQLKGETQPDDKVQLEVRDEWRHYDDYTPFYATAFTEVLFGRNWSNKTDNGNLIVNVYALNLPDNSIVVISGNCQTLGNWESSQTKELHYQGGGLWSISLNKRDLPETIEYKFLLRSHNNEDVLYSWEEGCNRTYRNEPNQISVINHNRINLSVQTPRIAGTAIPVFSIRSKDSCGIGDFGDLLKMVDFLSETSQNVLQLLPVNDTTATHSEKDSYPYNAISVFALHPLYLNLKMAGEISDNEFIENFNIEASLLNSLSEIDYIRTESLKLSYIRKLFEMTGEELLNSPEFELFYKEHSFWLAPYSIFCHLRDRYKTANFRLWAHFSTYNYQEVKLFSERDDDCKNDVKISLFVQYHLYKQLSQLKAYAANKRIILKGDLPIGISRNSVEAWTDPSLFNFDMQAGAPPDDFSENGQNWGFPTYNWDIMKQDGYMWWRKRLEFMSHFFDAFRIDHILGFFRIWEISLKYQDGLSGSFNPSYSYDSEQLINFNLEIISDNLIKNGLLIESPRENMRYIPKINAKKTQFYKLLKNSDQEAFDILYNHYYYHNNERLWSESGFLKLQEILSFTQMLACAEDLGMIPACVPKVLRHFRTLTLEIQRFTKEGDQKYANPSQYPYFSICTTGTHDTSTLRGWLNEVGEEEIQEELRHALKKETKTSNKREILRELLRINLDSPSFAAIFPLQDWFTLSDTLSQRDPDQERINIPADPDHIWNYRMHKTIEEVTCDNLFKNSLKTIIADSGRRSQI
jgi:4-alpha-glucanotransferase